MRKIRTGLFAVVAVILSSAAARGADSTGAIAYLVYTDGYWQAWQVSPAGDRATQVTRSPGDKVGCAWFPEARSLLVNTADGRVLRVDAQTGAEEAIALPGAVHDAAVSPDGKTLAFSMEIAGERDNNEIFVAHADGRDPRRLTHMPALQHEPAWSRDGKWIYFVSGDGGQAHDIWRVALDGSQREQLTAGALYHFEVSAGPAGELVYSGNQNGHYGLWFRPPSGEPRLLDTGQPFVGSPSFSPDGSEVAFEAMADGKSEIWRMKTAEGRPLRVTQTAGGARRPSWGPARGSR